jgi:uncharacterized protein (TIGR03086 family)
MTIQDLRTLHRQAVDEAGTFVRRVQPTDLDRPTPCAAWNLGQLLAHMVGQNRGFAAAVRAGSAEKSAYAPEPFDQEAWAESVDQLVTAFAGADENDRILEVELHPTERLPLEFVVSAQLLDTVVHTWDIASALDLAFNPSPLLVAPILAMAERIPDEENRRQPDAAFAPALPAPESDWGRLLALLGRRLSP